MLSPLLLIDLVKAGITMFAFCLVTKSSHSNHYQLKIETTIVGLRSENVSTCSYISSTDPRVNFEVNLVLLLVRGF